jgi:uncharacterized protein (UPF0333 family)
MTLKKSKRGQAIFEYFILTAVVVAAVLFFANSDFFKKVKDSSTNAFNNATEEMLK